MHGPRRISEALKSMLVGGLFVLVPLLLLVIVVAQALGLLVAIATPIADLFPSGTFDGMGAVAQVVSAAVLLLSASFVVGVAARAILAKRVGVWFETRVLGMMPMYEALKRLTLAFREVDTGRGFRAALLIAPDGASRQPAYLVEELDAGQCTVFLPDVPAGFTGSLAIVGRSRVEVLNVSLAEYTKYLGTWGLGLGNVLRRSGRLGG